MISVPVCRRRPGHAESNLVDSTSLICNQITPAAMRCLTLPHDCRIKVSVREPPDAHPLDSSHACSCSPRRQGHHTRSCCCECAQVASSMQVAVSTLRGHPRKSEPMIKLATMLTKMAAKAAIKAILRLRCARA